MADKSGLAKPMDEMEIDELKIQSGFFVELSEEPFELRAGIGYYGAI